MSEMRLIILVESSAELGSYWKTILNYYLGRIIRCFRSDASTSQDPCGATKSMLGLIIYGSEGPCYESTEQPSGWTSDVDTFLQWLSVISFSSATFDEGRALAKGLASPLRMTAATQHGNETQEFGQRHCILVASSNSPPLVRPLQLPQQHILEYGEISKLEIQAFLADAKAVARTFIQSLVSLSVISPKQSPRFREIYNVGNVNELTADCSSVNDDENPNYLVLLSNYFREAHAALNQHGLKFVPAIGSDHENTDFAVPLDPSFLENWSDDEMWTFQDIEKEDLPGSQQENQTDNILAAIELVIMDEKFDDDDTTFFFQEELNELTASQKKFLAENEEHKKVDELMMKFQEAIDQAETSQQELTEKHSCTALVQQKYNGEKFEDDDDCMIIQEKPSNPSMSQREIYAQNITTSTLQQQMVGEKSGHDDTIMIFGGIPSESTKNRQELPQKDIATALEKLAKFEPDAAKTKKLRKASPNLRTSQIEKEFGYRKLKVTPTGVVLSQNTSTAIAAGSPSESQIIGTGYKSPHETTGSLASASSTPNLCWSKPSSFKSESPKAAPRAAQKNTTACFGSEASNMYRSSKKSRPFTNFQGSASASHELLPSKAGRHFSWAQMAQDEYSLKRKFANAFGPFGQSSAVANGAGNEISMGENSEQGAKGSLAIANAFGIKTPLSQYASGALIERPPDGYVKAWEGDLTRREKGQIVVINRLVAYRTKTASESEMLLANWPQTLHMEQLIAKPQVDNTHGGRVEYLIFDAVNRHSKLEQLLEEKRLCAYIRLPQQTLILSVSIEKARFIGTLYHGDFAMF